MHELDLIEALYQCNPTPAQPQCSTCTRKLNNPADPLSRSCGGDCVECMADAGDPEELRKIAAELNSRPGALDT